MIIKYVKSPLGMDCDLCIASEDYKKANSEAGCGDLHPMLVAVKAYCEHYKCANIILSREIEEAFRHIKNKGTIILSAKEDGDVAWCEVYAVSEGTIIPVITIEPGGNKSINYSHKTLREMKKINEERHE